MATASEIVRPLIRPGYRVLDVGFGDATELEELASSVEDNGYVVGVDLDHKGIQEAVQQLNARDRDRIHVTQASIPQIPSPASVFDIVYCKGALHEVRNPGQALVEFKRVCREDGQAIVIDFQSLSRLRFEIYRSTSEILGNDCPDLHPGFAKDDIICIAESAGFSVERYEHLEEIWQIGDIEATPFIAVLSSHPNDPAMMRD